MSSTDIAALQAELEEFRREKESIRNLVGAIGGARSSRNDRIMTAVSMGALGVLFAVDVTRHLFGLHVPLPPLFSIELGVLLVSIKIIWMIHKQTKVEHFQFWILNSIEYRLNDVAKRLQKLDDIHDAVTRREAEAGSPASVDGAS